MNTQRMLAGVLVVAIGAEGASASGSAPPPGFWAVGVLPGGRESRPLGISGDGSRVVGFSTDGARLQPIGFTWRLDTGPTALAVPGGSDFAIPTSASFDGSVLAGSVYASGNPRAVRWTSGVPSVVPDGAPFQQSAAWAVSADGSVMTGDRLGEAYRWTSSGGFQMLGAVSGDTSSRGFGMSADGSVIAGESGFHAFKWASGAGMSALSGLPGNTFARANAVSGDGRIVVGQSGTGVLQPAVMWSETGAISAIGIAGDAYGEAFGVNVDGSVIVGGSTSGAFMWTSVLGSVNLNTYLAGVGFSLNGWYLTEARGVSADGLTIVGWGSHQIGASTFRMEAWVATIPGPGGAVVLGVLGLACVRRRRGRREQSV